MHLTDRSRLVAGQGRCQRLRYLNYYYDGTGIVPDKENEYTLLGIKLHEALAEITKLCYRLNGDCSSSHYRSICTTARQNYEEVLDNNNLPINTDEQVHLFECMLWGFIRTALPTLYEEFDLVSSEFEETMVIGCTCGINVLGSFADHDTRGCVGIGFMSRLDLILETRSSGELANLDFKSAKTFQWNWEKQFEDNIQLFTQLPAAERRLEREIKSSYILGLAKGNKEQLEEFGPEAYISPYTYIYYKSPNPPFEDEEIKLTYDYVDHEGKNRKATPSKGFERKAVWTLPKYIDLAARHGISLAEYWTFFIDETTVAQQYKKVGPLPKPERLMLGILNGIYTEESRWKFNLEAYKVAIQGKTIEEAWGLLDFYFPRSWECKRFNAHCVMLKICNEVNNIHLDPIGNGFARRVPHHEPELEK